MRLTARRKNALLQTFACYLHDGASAPRFVPIVRENAAEMMALARRMLEDDANLRRIEVHPCIGLAFDVLRADTDER